MKTTRAMLINPYPYIAVSFESPCFLVEQTESHAGSPYFFDEFSSRHFGAWDTDMAVPIRNYDSTIRHLQDKLHEFAKSALDIIGKGKIQY